MSDSTWFIVEAVITVFCVGGVTGAIIAVHLAHRPEKRDPTLRTRKTDK